jgi:hypothetical protein
MKIEFQDLKVGDEVSVFVRETECPVRGNPMIITSISPSIYRINATEPDGTKRIFTNENFWFERTEK